MQHIMFVRVVFLIETSFTDKHMQYHYKIKT